MAKGINKKYGKKLCDNDSVIKKSIKKRMCAGIACLAVLVGLAIPVSAYYIRNSNVNNYSTSCEGELLNSDNLENTLEVHFIDVGQGDSILLKQNTEAMLIDAGGADKGRDVAAYCENEGISELKYVVGTHAHEDHIGGMADIMEDIQVNNVIMTKKEYPSETYKCLLDVINDKHINEISPKAGDSYTLGSAIIEVEAPVRDDYKEENNNSIILKVTYGEVSYLFCGDAEIEEEYDMSESGQNISAQVLKIGHHGSDTSSSQMLLNTVRPSYAVISVGKGNDYGHPTDNIISRIKDYGIHYFRTDLDGTVVSVTDGENIAWSSKGTVSALDNSDVKYDYVVNKNTKKFHEPQCEAVEDISDRNRQNYWGDREELIEKGYIPCKRCNP